VLEQEIGRGAFAKVYKASCMQRPDCPVAIKIMNLEDISSSFEDIRQEVQTMRLAEHENVLKCQCSFVEGQQLWLVMDFMDQGSCLHVLTQSEKHGFGRGMKEEWLAYVLKQTLQGLEYFHRSGQVHRDVKAGNILLSSTGDVRLADFGVAGWLIRYGERHSTKKTFVGTPCWMAPEVMEQTIGYDYKADIWSFGITALELAKGFAPYAHYPPMKVLLMTIQEDPPSLKSYDDDKQMNGSSFSRHFKEMIRMCLQKDPKKRPACSTLLQHKFFKSDKTQDALNGEDGLVQGLLRRLPGTVCDQQGPSAERLPGTQPAYIRQNSAEQKTVDLSAQSASGAGSETSAKVAGDDHVPGTTWVFSDGSSGVLRSRGGSKAEEGEQHKDDLDSFYDEFEASTKGELNR